MTKYNTGNPVGSADPRDLSDNAKNADYLENGTAEKYPDRLGKLRKSRAGMEKDFDDFLAASGYQFLDDYAAGIEVTAYNQVIRDSGEFWRAAAGTSLPYTTTGSGMPEGGAFKSVGDAALRQELSGSNGADKVGRGSSTVADDLTAAENSAAAANSAASAALKATPAESLSVIDMHHGALHGLGFVSGENGSERSYAVQTAASAGSQTITLTTNTSVEFSDAPIVANQLIAYLSDDGHYYGVGVASVSGATLTLKTPLEADLSTGATVFNFYANESHPNKYGYRSIVDFAARNIRTSEKVIGRPKVQSYGGGTLSTNGANDKNNVGSAGAIAKTVTSTSAGLSGCSVFANPKRSGAHLLRARINTLGHAIRFSWSVGGLSDSLIVTNNGPEVVDFPFFIYDDSPEIEIRITCEVEGEDFLICETVEVIEVGGSRLALNRGKHVLLGDSWFEQMGEPGSGNLWFESRFPNAEFVNAGVGGNKAVQLVSRFDTDVTSQNPDFVWIMVGTNDIYGDVSPDLFSYYLNKLKAFCGKIGAHVVLFTGYVGSEDFSETRFDLSRQYRDMVTYTDRLIIDEAQEAGRLVTFPAVTVANGATINLGELGRHSGASIRAYEWFFSHDVDVEEATSILSPGTNVGTLSGGSLNTTDTDISHTPGRLIRLTHTNSSGSDVTVTGYAVIRDDFQR